MSLLSSLFGASVRLRNSLYSRGTLRARSLQGPVVSVGNISVGGAGKTPLVIAIGELFQQRNIAFDVLTRGYGRKSKGVREVDPHGAPSEFGDEPLLIAQRLGVHVIVGESRHAAGLLSEQRFGRRLHLLDDAFQHRQLARDFDIVIVTAKDVHDRLLPAGRLREPLAAIARADAVVIEGEVNPNNLPIHGDQHIWRVRRDIALPAITGPVLAFCAIARPDRFLEQLRHAGVTLAGNVSFPDHHPYTAADVESLLAETKRTGASGFVTTEKDVINLGPLAAKLQPLHVARVTLELLDSDHAFNTLLQVLVHRGKTP